MFPSINNFETVNDIKTNYPSCIVDGVFNNECMNSKIYDYNNLQIKTPEYSERISTQLTNDKQVNQVHFNRLPTKPYKSGKKLINRQKEHIVITGEDTHQKRSTNCLSEPTFNTFVPMIEPLENNLTSMGNIINNSRITVGTRFLKGDNNMYLNKCQRMISNINKNNKKDKNNK